MSITSRTALNQYLNTYTSSFPEEEVFISPFLQLLKQADCYHRHHLPGHLTGSAWIVNPARDRFLLVHHAKLNRWLQPGGHADGDENIFRVALREALEETGVKRLSPLHEKLFDIDIHTIPQRNGFPEHQHYDVRFAFEVPDDEPLKPTSESLALAWIDRDSLHQQTNGNASIRRMMEKTKTLS